MQHSYQVVSANMAIPYACTYISLRMVKIGNAVNLVNIRGNNSALHAYACPKGEFSEMMS
jgi:hypothetical protein